MNDNNENENEVRPRAPEGGDAEEQRERQEADETEDGVPAVDFAALVNNNNENEDVRRGRRDDVDADEQREHRGGDCDGDVPSIDPGAPNTYDISNDRSSAADVRGSNPECPNTVEATAIFAPEDCRACEICDLDDSTRPTDAKRGVPSQYLDCDVERDVVLERCEVDTSDTRPIWAVKLKRYPDGHINQAKARFCIRETTSSRLTCLMRPPEIMEQRERQESNMDEERVSPVAFDALEDIIYEGQSSATIREY